MEILNLFFGFKGRTSRSSWWLVQIINLVILMITFAAYGLSYMTMAGLLLAGGNFTAYLSLPGAIPLLMILSFMAWLNAAITVKRYHDRDKSGLWYLVSFVPYIGSLWVFIECGFLAGTPGSNQYDDQGGSLGFSATPMEIRGNFEENGIGAGLHAAMDQAIAARSSGATRQQWPIQQQSSSHTPVIQVVTRNAKSGPVFGQRGRFAT